MRSGMVTTTSDMSKSSLIGDADDDVAGFLSMARSVATQRHTLVVQMASLWRQDVSFICVSGQE